MVDVSDDPEQAPKTPIPAPKAPSPQMFARPAPQAPEHDATGQDATEQDVTGQDATEQDDAAAEISLRFASTGDPRVDRALAQLPDPDAHRQEAEDQAARSVQRDDATASDGSGRDDDSAGDDREQDDHGADNDKASGIDLPDPGLLDAHLADVTSVHRQLQQRLSDLSG